MAVTGLAEKTLVQVCVIVRDVERSARQYAAILGLDMPEEFQITREHAHTQATYYGEPMESRAKIAGVEIGQIQFELLQPLDAPSVWMDFLQQRGEGVHHVAFFVPDTGAAAASFAKHGYTVTQQGLFTGQTGKYTYLDTDRDLGVVVELLEHFGGNPTRSAPPLAADRGIGTDIVCQVGIIVDDIERTAQRYAEVFGLPQPPIVQTGAKKTYNGQPSDAIARLAFFDFGQLQVELIEPDEKPSIWRKFLDQHGTGAQHIAFRIKNTQRITDYLAGHGIGIAQQGLYSSENGMYTYMRSEAALGVIVELLENFEA